MYTEQGNRGMEMTRERERRNIEEWTGGDEGMREEMKA